MTRALSLVCLALVTVGGASVAHAGKPQIAVLGLEVIDPSGTPTAQDTQVAKELTDGLRNRAKAGTGPYQLAPGSDKELIDQKLLNNCDTEAVGCMAQIGSQLGAEALMFGKVQKEGNAYQVSIKVLDVPKKAWLKSSSDLVPLNQAAGAALQGWAKRIYAKLTGESMAGTLVIKLQNADRATVLIDGTEKGNVTNGTGQVTGLPEGKYKAAIEADGFRRWERDVTIVAGQTTTLPVELEPGSGPGLGTGGGGGGGGGVDGPPRGSTTWKFVAAGAVLVSGAGIGMALYGDTLRADASKKLCGGGGYRSEGPSTYEGVDCRGAMQTLTQSEVDSLNDKGDRGKLFGRIGAGIAIGAGGFALFAAYKGFLEKGAGDAERPMAGRRTPRDRFVVTPIVSPDGGGATLRIDW